MDTQAVRKLSVRMEARYASRRELQLALLAWLDVVSRADGVLRAHVYEDVVLSGVFGVEAVTSTAAAMQMHLRSDSFGGLVGALGVLADHVQMSISQLTWDSGSGSFSSIRTISLEETNAPAPPKGLR